MTVFTFADLAGFAALTEAHGDEDAHALIEAFTSLIREHLPPSARLVKVVGDAAMIAGDDAAEAVALARELVRASDELPGRPALRVGIHCGDAVERDGDYWGHAVNVAARVASEARASEILVTDAVRQRLPLDGGGPEGDVVLAPLGERRLRNLAERIALYAVSCDVQDYFTDPVCRMRLSAPEAAGRIDHNGRVYYFCSPGCIRAFVARPQAYA